MSKPDAEPVDADVAEAPPSTPELVRIALHPETTRDDVDDAMCAREWLLVQIVPASTTHPSQAIFLDRDRTTILYYVEDPNLDAAYVVVRGPALHRVHREVLESLRTCSRDDLLARSRLTDPQEVSRALLLLGITTLAPDELVLARMLEALSDPVEQVRAAARAAAGALGWAEARLRSSSTARAEQDV